jgi:hypothetical protein
MIEFMEIEEMNLCLLKITYMEKDRTQQMPCPNMVEELKILRDR